MVQVTNESPAPADEIEPAHDTHGLHGTNSTAIPLTSTSTAQQSSHLPPPRVSAASTGGDERIDETRTAGVRQRHRATLPERTASSPADVEAAARTPESRLRRIADRTRHARDDVAVAHVALQIVYGEHAAKQPDDVLQSLLERAPVYREHGITTEAELRGFLGGKSLAERAAPFVGNMGYLLALSLAGSFVGAHVPSPATGLPIGALVMGTTIHTGAMRSGLEAYIGPLVTTGLPPSVQKRFDCYQAAAMPAGVRPEMIRQVTRALVTVVPMLMAMHQHQPMDQAAVVRNDVFADAATFTAAPYLDDALASLGSSMKHVVDKVVQSSRSLKQQGLDAPTHAELVAHQPVEVLEQRLLNHRKSAAEASADAVKAMGQGVKSLYTETPGRLVGVPVQAGFVIAIALIVTSHLIDEDPKNADLPAGKITPRSSMAVPGALMVMEYLATQAFGTLLSVCDSLASRSPASRRHEESGAVIDDSTPRGMHDTRVTQETHDTQETDDTRDTRDTVARPAVGLPRPPDMTRAAPESSTTAAATSGTQPTREAVSPPRSGSTDMH